jgi:DNA-binding response OmpR family regulator
MHAPGPVVADADLPSVLVVDDDPVICSALQRALRLQGFAVAAVGSGRAALDAMARQPPDVAVVDLSLPDVDGVDVIRRLRADGVDVPVCVLSARRQVDQRVTGLEAGADDYLVKPFATEELVARLHALLRRRPHATGVPLQAGTVRVDPPRRLAWRGTRPLHLTRREFDLLETFVRHPGVVLTRAQLLAQVWGYDFAVESNVVDVFVGYLRRKLEHDGEPRIIQTVRGVGFVLRPMTT